MSRQGTPGVSAPSHRTHATTNEAGATQGGGLSRLGERADDVATAYPGLRPPAPPMQAMAAAETVAATPAPEVHLQHGAPTPIQQGTADPRLAALEAPPARLTPVLSLPWAQAWEQQLRMEGKSRNTIRTYLCGARKLVGTPLPEEFARHRDEVAAIRVSELRTRMKPDNGRLHVWLQGMSEARPTTVNARLASASHLLEWLGWSMPEHITRPRRGRRLPRTLSGEELQRLRQASADSEHPLAKVIVTLLLDSGMRVSELCRLDDHDVDLADKSARVVGGKGNKDRLVLFTEESAASIRAWLNLRRHRGTRHDMDALFVNQHGRRLTPRNVQKLLDRLAGAAEIATNRVSPHVLRHNFATGLLRRGADLVTIQRLLGHASIATTRIYLEIEDSTIREVYRRAQAASETMVEGGGSWRPGTEVPEPLPSGRDMLLARLH